MGTRKSKTRETCCLTPGNGYGRTKALAATLEASKCIFSKHIFFALEEVDVSFSTQLHASLPACAHVYFT